MCSCWHQAEHLLDQQAVVSVFGQLAAKDL